MSSWTIGRKITVTCAVLIALVVALGGTSFYSVSSLNSKLDVLLFDSLPGVMTLGSIDSLTAEMRGDMLAHIESRSDEERSKFESDLSEKYRACTESLKKHAGAAMSEQERQLFDRIGPSLERVMRQWRKVEALGRAGKLQEASAAFAGAVDPAYGDAMKLVDEALRTNQANAAKEGEAAQQTGERSHFAVVLILALAVLGGSALAFFIVRGVNQTLRQTVSELSEGAEQVAAASSQVSASSQSLAQGASEQAASIEETSASTEEINSMTRKNAENSRSAADFMTEAAQRVSEANRTLQQMVVSMKDITASSDKISKIIKVIDEIAFQTNILALNAAVEAARAGEAGMGFAVVADEVRNLAQRSAQAAKDTASMIEESISKSNDGSAKLNQVVEAIGGITESSNKVKTLVDEVNLGSQEQARGLDQISQAIAQMEQVTQKTAANAEESASASEELNAQAETMRAVVLRLRTMVDGSSAEKDWRASQPSARSLSGQAEGSATPQPKSRATSKGLSALKHAISAHQVTVDHAAHEPAVQAAKAGKQAIPLEGDFKEF